MKEYYSRQQAMQRLGLQSVNLFFQLERKYPEVFRNLNPHASKHKPPWYDKALINKFAETREHLKQEKS